MSTLALHLAQNLRDQVIGAANAAFPLECCGLIEGVATRGAWHVHAIHPAKNLAKDPADHFLVDPQTHFELLRGLRGSERCIIGCFHSHPNGLAMPSADDRANAIEQDFVWLIASGKELGAFDLFVHVFDEAAGGFVPLELRH